MSVASTPALEADRQDLIALIGAEAVFHGDFTLSSGTRASYYVDMRRLTLDHRAAPAIGRLVLDLIRDIPDVSAVGGLTLGADPIANAVVVEDTSTTGQSALKAVEVLRREGAEVVAVAVIVDRRTGARPAVEAEGLTWLASIDLDDLGLPPQ